MKRLITNNAVNRYELEELGIDAIYYNEKELVYADCNGNNIYPDELDEEALEIIQQHIERDDGEEVEEER